MRQVQHWQHAVLCVLCCVEQHSLGCVQHTLWLWVVRARRCKLLVLTIDSWNSWNCFMMLTTIAAT